MDEFEESMPGYHEYEEFDRKEISPQTEFDEDLFEIEPLPTLTFSSHHVGQAESLLSMRSPKPKSRHLNETAMLEESQQSSTANKQDAAENQTCPVCNKTFEIDNAGLNAHVDFCLSRGAIMTAQVEASKSGKLAHSQRQQLKPTSMDKRVSTPLSASKRGRE